MLHKPTQRKIPKKYQNSEKAEVEQIKKASSKPVMRSASNAPILKTADRQPSVRGRVNKVEQKVDQVVKGLKNVQLQNLLIEEIKSIKTELKQIKHHIGINGTNPYGHHKGNERRQAPSVSYEQENDQEQDQQEEQQNIYNVKPTQQQNSNRPSKHEQPSNEPVTQNRGSRVVQPNNNQSRAFQQPRSNPSNGYKLNEKQKELMDVGKIQPYMRQFKIEVTKNMMPFYHGYHKKSSKPVIIKYCHQSKSMEPIFNLYERLWKNIVKAKSICINKVYDLNEPLATYILVLEANKYSLLEMLSNRVANVSQILCSVLKALQFFHECGFLYRNLHPYHVMYSYENEVVLVDLKNVRRFVDIKGKHVAVVREGDEMEDQFVSNSRARKLKQGRKDDLESLGYLALFILQGWLPWNINNLVQVRSKLTLKQLCGKYPGLLEYMIIVSQMATEDVPDYEKLAQCLSQI